MKKLLKKIFEPEESFCFRLNKNEVINLLPFTIILWIFVMTIIILNESDVLNCW